jgi:hypothetical protein
MVEVANIPRRNISGINQFGYIVLSLLNIQFDPWNPFGGDDRE